MYEMYNFSSKARDWSCSQCNRSYTQLGNLSRHIKYECGKPAYFSCQYCGRKFTQESNLRRHLITQHNKKISSKS